MKSKLIEYYEKKNSEDREYLQKNHQAIQDKIYKPKTDEVIKRVNEYQDYLQLKQKYNKFLKGNEGKLDSLDDKSKTQLTTFFKANFEILDEDTKQSLQETKIYKEYHKEQTEKQINQIGQIQQSQQQTGGKNQNKLGSNNLLSLARNVIASESQDTAETFSNLLTEKSENIDMRVLKQISQLFTKAQKTDIAKGAIEQKEKEANNKLGTIYELKDVRDLNTELKKLELNKILTSVSEDSIKTFQDFLKTNSHLIDTKTFKSLGEKLNKVQAFYFQDDIAITDSNPAIDNLARFVEEKSEGLRVKDNLSYYGRLMAKTSLSYLGYDQKLLEIKRPSNSPNPKVSNTLQPNTTRGK